MAAVPLPPLIPGSLQLESLEVQSSRIRELIKQQLLNVGQYKGVVSAASIANIATLSGLLTIDGVVLVAGDIVLVKNQTTASQNGLYIASTGVWPRSDQLPLGSQASGTTVFVGGGVTNNQTVWACTQKPGSDIVGTNNLTFSSITSTVGGAGGLTTQVQFNSVGILAGDADFTFDAGTNTLSIVNVTSSGTITGGTLTDGTLSTTAGVLTGVASIASSGTITGATLTDGTLAISSGAVTGATNITASGTLTGNVLTDGATVITGGVISGVTTLTASGVGTLGSLVLSGKGTVTQLTSITTAVTLNTASGVITTVSSTLAADLSASFTVNNSTVVATSVVLASVSGYSGTGVPHVNVTSVGAGSFVITLTNVGTAALNSVVVISFVRV